MDPGSWIMAASAVVGAISSMDAADARADAARAQANMSATSATIARQSADNALQMGNANEEEQRRRSALLLGQKRAGLLAAGIGAEGSAGDVYAQDVGNETLKALQSRYDGQMKSWSALNQAGLADQQTAASLAGANAAESADTLGAATSLLSGAGQIYGRLYPATPGTSVPKIADAGITADDLSPGRYPGSGTAYV